MNQQVEINKKEDSAAREKLVTARIGLLLNAPFFGHLASRMKLVNADDWLSTAATDGRNFYYNSKFVNSLPLRQAEFLVGHEVLHAVYDHIGRCGGRDRKIANIAMDFVVNADLISQRLGEKISVVPVLYNKKYEGWSFEEVYDDLIENSDKVNLSELAEQVLDDHIEGDQECDGDSDKGNGDGSDQNGGRGKRPTLSDEERRAIRDELRQATIQASQSVKSKGDIPLGVQRLIKNLTEPKINWRELLEQQVQSVLKDDFSWMRPSRRNWHIDAIFPGTIPGNMIDIAIALDMSGSISDEDSRVFLSEIKGIMDSYTDYSIRLWCFDTDIYNDETFTPDCGKEIVEYEPAGGGGTSIDRNWTYMQENDIVPQKFIVFTDLYDRITAPEDYCDTVWIIKGNPNAEPPFGVWAHYENSTK